MNKKPLITYTIFDHPADYPGSFVVRAFTVTDGEPIPAEGIMYESQDANRCRDFLAGKGLVNLGRMAGDDPVILETWV